MLQRRDITWWGLASLLALGLVFHFGMVLLSLLPLNPLSYGAHDLIDAYIYPLFAQNWGLFAPNPVSADTVGYARGYYHDGARESTTAWIDFTGPLLDRVRSSRLSPMNLPVTVLSKAMGSTYTETGITDTDASHREVMMAKWEDPGRRPRGWVVLEAAGAAALCALYPKTKFERIQVMINIRPVPRFSKRYDPKAEEPNDYLVFHPSMFPTVISWFAPTASRD